MKHRIVQDSIIILLYKNKIKYHVDRIINLRVIDCTFSLFKRGTYFRFDIVDKLLLCKQMKIFNNTFNILNRILRRKQNEFNSYTSSHFIYYITIKLQILNKLNYLESILLAYVCNFRVFD